MFSTTTIFSSATNTATDFWALAGHNRTTNWWTLCSLQKPISLEGHKFFIAGAVLDPAGSNSATISSGA